MCQSDENLLAKNNQIIFSSHSTVSIKPVSKFPFFEKRKQKDKCCVIPNRQKVVQIVL